jgi:hypothetical protein
MEDFSNLSLNEIIGLFNLEVKAYLEGLQRMQNLLLQIAGKIQPSP